MHKQDWHQHTANARNHSTLGAHLVLGILQWAQAANATIMAELKYFNNAVSLGNDVA